MNGKNIYQKLSCPSFCFSLIIKNLKKEKLDLYSNLRQHHLHSRSSNSNSNNNDNDDDADYYYQKIIRHFIDTKKRRMKEKSKRYSIYICKQKSQQKRPFSFSGRSLGCPFIHPFVWLFSLLSLLLLVVLVCVCP